MRHAQDREVSPRYGEGFGKRPDVLSYPTDILEFAKRKATSFHCSEERWSNPLHIKTGATRKEMNELRSGWDLVLDIDAKNWEISRLTAWLFIEALKAHGIKSISLKFSGNKGWHIGVPFEAFPKTVLDIGGKDVETKDLFPELPRAIATYLLDFMSDMKHGLITLDQDKVTFGWREHDVNRSDYRKTYTFTEFSAMADKQAHELFESYCPSCKKIVNAQQQTFILACPVPDCLHRVQKQFTADEKSMMSKEDCVCPKCRYIMQFQPLKRGDSCQHSTASYERRFKLTEVIEIDTVLLASRHLYRMAYSLHEKSGLVSVVIDPARVLEFTKEEADPKNVSFDRMFLDPSGASGDEAAALTSNAWREQQERDEKNVLRRNSMALEVATEAIPEEHFPPCMHNILAGMTDGKKRAMFALTNFLMTAGWNADMIEKKLYEWNENNGKVGDPLREVIIKGHMHQVRMKKERILPPNCRQFYLELQVCKPNEFCSRIKNPGPYALKHAKLGVKAKKPRISKPAEVTGGKENRQESQESSEESYE